MPIIENVKQYLKDDNYLLFNKNMSYLAEGGLFPRRQPNSTIYHNFSEKKPSKNTQCTHTNEKQQQKRLHHKLH